jgi:holo-[acyl-carrier protein] synthase
MTIRLPEGGIVIGLGTDLVDVDRVRMAIERHGERFLNRVFTAEEQAYCGTKAVPYPHYAARFAAKEAVSKAFTTGIGAAFSWKSVSITKGSREEPYALLDEQGQALLTVVGGHGVMVSLSHTATQAQAVALVIKKV